MKNDYCNNDYCNYVYDLFKTWLDTKDSKKEFPIDKLPENWTPSESLKKLIEATHLYNKIANRQVFDDEDVGSLIKKGKSLIDEAIKFNDLPEDFVDLLPSMKEHYQLLLEANADIE